MSDSTVLRAEELTEKHSELPDGWRRSIGQLRALGWPWNCHVCEAPSYLFYRCSRCGRDLTNG